MIQREFASYRTETIHLGDIYEMLYRVTEAGEEYIGGYEWYTWDCKMAWSTLIFKDDQALGPTAFVVPNDDWQYLRDGYRAQMALSNPRDWIIDRGERQLKEHFESLQQVFK